MLLWAAMLIAGTYIIWTGGSRMFRGWQLHLAQTIKHHTERLYMPGLASLQNNDSQGFGEWITSQAMHIIPLSSYMESKSIYHTRGEDWSTQEMILALQAGVENEVDEHGNLIDGGRTPDLSQPRQATQLDLSIERLRDFNYLISNFYVVDPTTMIGPEQLNVDELLAKDMQLTGEDDGPRVLIFHVHSQEGFVDSVPGDPNTHIVGVGAYLTRILNEKGIPTMHHTGVYDMINGRMDRSRAYEKMEPSIRRILAENPSIEIVIDLHRDGVREDLHLITDIGGVQTAQIMFFNGLSRTRTIGDIAHLPNPYIQDNLAFSLQMQLEAERNFPGFARRIYLRGFRYSLHMMPRSLLIEAGAQTNTLREVKNAMYPLAEVLANIIDPD